MPTLSPALSACPIARAADVLGDRWSLLVLRDAAFGTARFSDFRSRLRIASDVLSDRLQRLVDDGLLERVAYRDDGDRTRHEYRLTAAGRDFRLVLAALGAWGAAHLPAAAPSAAAFRDGTGRPLRAAFVDERGSEVRPGPEARFA